MEVNNVSDLTSSQSATALEIVLWKTNGKQDDRNSIFVIDHKFIATACQLLSFYVRTGGLGKEYGSSQG